VQTAVLSLTFPHPKKASDLHTHTVMAPAPSVSQARQACTYYVVCRADRCLASVPCPPAEGKFSALHRRSA
jgi:hypothetical protein